MASQYVSDNSGTYIPATQRPDGSWRKARRVKEGYVPQEEVPLYESKGKQWAKSQSAYPPGLNPIVSPQSDGKNNSAPQIIPGLTTIVSDVSKSSKKKKKKKSKSESTDDAPNKVSVEFQKLEISSPLPKSEDKPTIDNSPSDPVKRLKNLKKKLREIENLESRIASGELAKPEKEQLDKISRKEEIEMLIDDLEMEIENS